MDELGPGGREGCSRKVRSDDGQHAEADHPEEPEEAQPSRRAQRPISRLKHQGKYAQGNREAQGSIGRTGHSTRAVRVDSALTRADPPDHSRGVGRDQPDEGREYSYQIGQDEE